MLTGLFTLKSAVSKQQFSFEAAEHPSYCILKTAASIHFLDWGGKSKKNFNIFGMLRVQNCNIKYV